MILNYNKDLIEDFKQKYFFITDFKKPKWNYIKYINIYIINFNPNSNNSVL